MSRRALYVLFSLWLALLLFHVWKENWISDMVFSGSSMLVGTAVLLTDPRTTESRRVGYKPIGITLLVGGVIAGLLAIYRRFHMF